MVLLRIMPAQNILARANFDDSRQIVQWLLLVEFLKTLYRNWRKSSLPMIARMEIGDVLLMASMSKVFQRFRQTILALSLLRFLTKLID